MTPERQENIGPHKVQEYYWNRKKIVYVDNRLTEKSFDRAVSDLQLADALLTERFKTEQSHD